MFNIEQNEMRDILTQLDQAIDNHVEWFNSITRTLV